MMKACWMPRSSSLGVRFGAAGVALSSCSVNSRSVARSRHSQMQQKATEKSFLLLTWICPSALEFEADGMPSERIWIAIRKASCVDMWEVGPPYTHISPLGRNLFGQILLNTGQGCLERPRLPVNFPFPFPRPFSQPLTCQDETGDQEPNKNVILGPQSVPPFQWGHAAILRLMGSGKGCQPWDVRWCGYFAPALECVSTDCLSLFHPPPPHALADANFQCL